MKLEKIADCFLQEESPIIIFCNIKDAEKIVNEVKEVFVSGSMSGAFENIGNSDRKASSVFYKGKTFYFIDIDEFSYFADNIIKK